MDLLDDTTVREGDAVGADTGRRATMGGGTRQGLLRTKEACNELERDLRIAAKKVDRLRHEEEAGERLHCASRRITAQLLAAPPSAALTRLRATIGQKQSATRLMQIEATSRIGGGALSPTGAVAAAARFLHEDGGASSVTDTAPELRAAQRSRRHMAEAERLAQLAAVTREERAALRLSVARARTLAQDEGASKVARAKHREAESRALRVHSVAAAAARRRLDYEERLTAEAALQARLQQQVRRFHVAALPHPPAHVSPPCAQLVDLESQRLAALARLCSSQARQANACAQLEGVLAGGGAGDGGGGAGSGGAPAALSVTSRAVPRPPMASMPVKSFRSDGGGGRGGIGGRFDRRSSGAVKAVYGWNGLAAAAQVPHVPPARILAAPAEQPPPAAQQMPSPPLIPADALGGSVVVKRGGWRGGTGHLEDSPSLGPPAAVGASPGSSSSSSSSSGQSPPWQDEALASSPPCWPTPPLTGADLTTHHPATIEASALAHDGHPRTSFGTAKSQAASLPRVRGMPVLPRASVWGVLMHDSTRTSQSSPHAWNFLPLALQATPTFRGDHATREDGVGHGGHVARASGGGGQPDSARHDPPPREAIEDKPEERDASTTAPRQPQQQALPAAPMALQQLGSEPRPQLRSGGSGGGSGARLLSLERGLLAHSLLATPSPAQLSSPAPAAATPEGAAYTPLQSPAGFFEQQQHTEPGATPSSQDSESAGERTRPLSSPRPAAAAAGSVVAATTTPAEGHKASASGGGPGAEPEESKGAGDEGGGGRRSEGCVALSFEGAESS